MMWVVSLLSFILSILLPFNNFYKVVIYFGMLILGMSQK